MKSRTPAGARQHRHADPQAIATAMTAFGPLWERFGEHELRELVRTNALIGITTSGTIRGVAAMLRGLASELEKA